ASLVAPAAPHAAPAAGSGNASAAQWALIVNGDDSFTHNYNVALALSSLSQLGYAPQNTLVLAPAAASSSDAGADAPAIDATAAGPAPWRQPATEHGLKQALAQLHERLRPGDLLLVYLTGHGYRMFGRTSLELQGGSITARELMQRLGELPFGKLILIADQCYSGGFADAALALGRNAVAVSSTDDRHEVRCEPFIRPFWLAAVAAHAQPAPGSAASGKGFVSIEEAFRVAADGLRQAGAGGSGDAPRIAASGTCSGRENPFSAVTLNAAGGPGSDQRASGVIARR
ncbi:MAG: caspase family protein, partial [Acidobacteria bacterium]|nr:caspase family protein [Acidobacteriota bacterium]